MRTSNRTPITARAVDDHELLRNARRALFAAIQEKGFTQASLARRMNLSEAQISRALHANETMSLRTFACFSEALGVRFEFARVEEGDD